MPSQKESSMTANPQTANGIDGQPSNLPSPDELAGRLVESMTAAMDLYAVYVGEQLGLYRALHEQGPATSEELAARTGMHERYAREWLEHQAITGMLTFDNASKPAQERVYALPPGYEGVLINPESSLFVAPLGRMLTATVSQAPSLLSAYRTGSGVGWSTFGDDMRSAQADFNRPLLVGSLVPDYLSQISGLDQALQQPGARIAEIGPGGGWASVALAGAYPQAVYEGFDLDGPSVEMANANLAAAGLADRARVFEQDAAEASSQGRYDLVCAFECIHDLSDPVGVLTSMRRLAKPDGRVIVMDERCAEDFGAVGDLLERYFYGFSLMVCLPDGMSHRPSAGTGTVMRPSTLDAYAREAGFARAEVLPLENDFFRFYELVLTA